MATVSSDLTLEALSDRFYFCGPPSRRGARELIRKPRPLAVIRNRRLNSVALLVPLRSVQFSAFRTSECTTRMHTDTVHHQHHTTLHTMVPLMIAVAFAVSDTHPVSRHVGRWTVPPRHCPSSMVTDAPILGNGDMGAVVCGGQGSAVSFLVGKMDFWTQSHGPNATYKTPRHLATHVAAGYVTLSAAPTAATARPSSSRSHAWNCSVFNCTCMGMAYYYGVLAGVGFGCAPPNAQAWWKAQPCNAHAGVGCCKGPACSLPGALPCGCGHPHPSPHPPSPPPSPRPAPAAGFTASQELQTARVNLSCTTTPTAGPASQPPTPPHAQPVTLILSSIVAARQNVLLTRVTVDRPAVLLLTLGAQNSMDLPIAPGHTNAALTLERRVRHHCHQYYLFGWQSVSCFGCPTKHTVIILIIICA